MGRIHTVVISPVHKNPSGCRTATLRRPNRVWLLTLKLATETVPWAGEVMSPRQTSKSEQVRWKQAVANLLSHHLDPICPFIRVTRNQMHLTLQPSPSTAVATLQCWPS